MKSLHISGYNYIKDLLWGSLFLIVLAFTFESSFGEESVAASVPENLKNGAQKTTLIANNHKPRSLVKARTRIRKNNRYAYYISEAPQMTFYGQGRTDGCEVASIKDVLSIHHKALHTSLDQMIRKIGWRYHGNWNHHYRNNPWRRGTGAEISPWLQARIIRRYGVRAHVHNYLSKARVIHDLRHGKQLVIEAGHNCNAYNTDHIIAIVGIRKDHHSVFIQYADSDYANKKHGVRWCPFRKFWRSYNRPAITGDRCVVAVN